MDEKAVLDAVLQVHRLETLTQCGAISIPVVHHHSTETDRRPGPKRVLRCTNTVGHEGPHKDAICCWHFQEFEDWQVADRDPRASDRCTCGTIWPCSTITALQEASL